MLYDIRTYGDEALREETGVVEKITEDIKKILDDMVETMHGADGVGLAAPQIGVSLKMLVIDANDGKIRKVINPEFLEYSEEQEEAEEGCLSIPGVHKKVKRPARIKVKYLNENGEEVVEEADGLLARIFQHENDHLNAVLFTDRISPIAKRMVSKKLQKLKKDTMKHKKED